MTTTIVKTIGTGGDYSTLQSWEDACPASLVSLDQIWQGRVKNQEFSGTGGLLVISGTTVSANCYVELTTDIGASFSDHASKATNPLRYDATKGAAIKMTGVWSIGVTVGQNYTRISKLQLSATSLAGGAGSMLDIGAALSATNCSVDKCIIEGYSSGIGGVLNFSGSGNTLSNSLVVQKRTGTPTAYIAQITSGVNAYNCTLVSIGGTLDSGIRSMYASEDFRNCYIGGATVPVSGNATVTKTTSHFSGTASGFTTTPLSTATFENIIDGTHDLRLKAGSGLIDVGTTDATYAATDILGTARTTYDVGAWESGGGGGGGDTTIPTLTGVVTVSALTTTSYTATWPSGSDNVAITGYEYRLNAGSWVSVGNVLTIGISARTPGSTDTFEVRAYDAAANKSTPALSTSVTLADIAVGTITFPAVKDWSTGNLKLNESGVTVIVNNVTTGALVIKLTGKTTHATTGVCTVSDALIIAGTQYRATLILADGSEGTWKYSAT